LTIAWFDKNKSKKQRDLKRSMMAVAVIDQKAIIKNEFEIYTLLLTYYYTLKIEVYIRPYALTKEKSKVKPKRYGE